MRSSSSDYAHPDWRQPLERAGWDRFETVWALEHRWVQPINKRRYGGWGGVARHELPGPRGPLGVYLKVHDGQSRRSPLRPLRGRPVLARELESLRRCERLGIPSPVPVYYAARRVGGAWRSLLATAELVDCRPLRTWLDEWRRTPPPEQRDAAIAEVASLLRRLHRAHTKVNSFTPDHVFLRCAEGGVEAHLIDLERLEPCLQPRKALLADLTTLRRTATDVRAADWLRFVCAYLERPEPDAEVRRLARAVETRLARKLERRARRREKSAAVSPGPRAEG